MKKTILILTLALITPTFIQAQFEHRFSATLSGGYLFPFGVRSEDGIDDILSDTYDDPYLFSNFGNGFALNGALYLNTKGAFSLGIYLDYLHCGSWDYDYSNEAYLNNAETGSPELYLNRLKLNSYGVGLAPKLFFNPKSKVRVYMLIEISANRLSVEYENEQTEVSKVVVDKVFAIGLQPALGIDFRVTEKVGIFLQHGLSMQLFSDDYIEEWYDLQKDNLNVFRIDLGVRYNFLKSKRI